MKIGTAVLLLCVIPMGCKHDETDEKPVVAVKIIRSERIDVPLRIEAPATIFGRSHADVASRLTAPIRRLNVRKGDDVKAGQILAVLEQSDLRADEASAAANLTNAQISLERTSKGMKLFHMSFNLMTLGGLAACIGVVIDDAIVIVENIMVHLSTGETSWDAAKHAIQELTPALIGSTLTPIVVFVPLVFLDGITAVFFRALAMTMVTALLASLLLAIFFTPVPAGAFLRTPARALNLNADEAEQAGEGPLLRRLTGHYERLLTWALGHPRSILAISGGILAVSVLIYFQLGTGFLPDMDEGAFVLDYRTPPGTSLVESNRCRGVPSGNPGNRKLFATHGCSPGACNC